MTKRENTGRVTCNSIRRAPGATTRDSDSLLRRRQSRPGAADSYQPAGMDSDLERKLRSFHRSGESRQKHSCLPLVLGEAGTEFLGEERLLAAGLNVEGEPGHSDGEQRAHFPQGDGGSPEREQNPGVCRKAKGTIRTRSN